ncbi:MAG TPA: hypothetical protein VMT62_11475 [Syntrophorhabdaceae bacterium]|nr:hypothetical protein [Syntrophorhabdaceae bacterium]
MSRNTKTSNGIPHRRLLAKEISSFRATIYGHYRIRGRELPWRNTDDPYHILVSEIMLQQTQVERVLQKYGPFIARFPHVIALAGSPLSEVLRLWQGLGYNRRALSLVKIARIVASELDGRIPEDPEALMRLPGIGQATAGSILSFAFQKPFVFVETNIRRTFIHHFFQDRKEVHDREIMPLVEATLDRTNPREWYYALMDYGSHLKGEVENPNRRSIHYSRQSRFNGSDRMIRGAILKILVEKGSVTTRKIISAVSNDSQRVTKILRTMECEGLIVRSGNTYKVA